MHFVDSKLIDHLPTPVRIEDFRELKQFLAQLKQQGVQDIQTLLDDDLQHEFLVLCLKKIKLIAANRATLDLYQAANFEELSQGLHINFCPEMYPALRKCLIALWQDQPFHSDTMVNYTVSGKRLVVSLHSVIISSEPDAIDHYLVSTVDLTERFVSMPQASQVQQLSDDFFNHAPIAMMLCDARVILKRFQHLRDVGIENFEQHLDTHSDWVDECWAQFVFLQCNPACLAFFDVGSLTELVAKYHATHQISLHKNFTTLLKRLWTKFSEQSSHAISFPFQHNTLNVLMHCQLLPDGNQSWSKMLLCLTDISDHVQIDHFRTLLSQRHPISKLYNNSYLHQEISRLQLDFVQPISCIYIQVDRSHIYDSQATDFIAASLLSRLSDILHYLIKRPFTAAHINHYEIVILLPGCQAAQTQQKMQQIHELVQVDQEFYHRIPLHIAMGSACCYPNESIEQMIVRADQNRHNNQLHDFKS